MHPVAGFVAELEVEVPEEFGEHEADFGVAEAVGGGGGGR